MSNDFEDAGRPERALVLTLGAILLFSLAVGAAIGHWCFP